MFLKNYDNFWVAAHLSNNIFASAGVLESGDYDWKSTSGTNKVPYIGGGRYNESSSYRYVRFVPLALEPAYICLGDGDVPVTYEDYCLSGNVVNNKLVGLSTKTEHNLAESKYTKTKKCTYSNTTDEDVTIKEWGLWFPYNSVSTSTSTTYSNSSSYMFLAFREVLDEPIVIEAGTTATLTFKLDIPMPTHP